MLIENLAEAERICFKNSAYNLSQLKEIEANKERYTIFIKEINKEIVAYIIVYDNSECYEIMKIATLPQYRKGGYATELLNQLIIRNKDIFLEVRESNLPAIEFYKKNGFKQVGKRKNYYDDTGEAALIMIRENK